MMSLDGVNLIWVPLSAVATLMNTLYPPINGVNACTTTGANFTQPAVAANVSVTFLSTAWMAAGQVVYIASGGYYSVSSITSSTVAVLTNLGYVGNANVGNTVVLGSAAVPGGVQPSAVLLGGTMAPAKPSVVNASAYSQTSSDSSLIFTYSGTTTLTLLAAASYPGQMLFLKLGGLLTTVISGSANVVPMNSTTAGNAIMTTANKFAVLQSDGTNWQIMQLV